MNYAAIKNCDIANGTGVRVSLFVSGCNHRCPGCFNSEAWDFDYGEVFDGKVSERILKLLEPSYIKGITYLGGEPFDPRNQGELLRLTKDIRSRYKDKTVWCFTGYLFEDIALGRVGDKAVASELLSMIDVLVDGPFVEEKKNLSLNFRGSENQRIIDVQRSLKERAIVLYGE